MKEDMKNHFTDASLGISSTHAETMVKLPREEKQYKKPQRRQ